MVWHQGGLLVRLVADNKGQVELGLRRGSGTREVELERGPGRLGKAGVHRRDPLSNRWNVGRESRSVYAVFSSAWHRKGSQLKCGEEGKEKKEREGRGGHGGKEGREGEREDGEDRRGEKEGRK